MCEELFHISNPFLLVIEHHYKKQLNVLLKVLHFCSLVSPGQTWLATSMQQYPSDHPQNLRFWQSTQISQLSPEFRLAQDVAA